MFITQKVLAGIEWQAFERLIARLLIHQGYKGVRVVGGSGDEGADIVAESPTQRRWLVQAKFWRKPVSQQELRKTLEAAKKYRAACSVVVGLNGFDHQAREFQKEAMHQSHHLTLWSALDLLRQAAALNDKRPVRTAQGNYQKEAIDLITHALVQRTPKRFAVVMATGLGKTFTTAAALQRFRGSKEGRVLVLAHTNSLVLQLEKAFWGFLSPAETTAVWNQSEKPNEPLLQSVDFLFATRDSVANYIKAGGILPHFDVIIIDECHHAHSKSVAYQSILSHVRAGDSDGPQLVGLNITP